jgi:hypothetical protein
LHYKGCGHSFWPTGSFLELDFWPGIVSGCARHDGKASQTDYIYGLPPYRNMIRKDAIPARCLLKSKAAENQRLAIDEVGTLSARPRRQDAPSLPPDVSPRVEFVGGVYEY